jgi:hypothetical protein
MTSCSSQETGFDMPKLLVDVFDPQPGEVVLVMIDRPHGALKDSIPWQERRFMAETWRQAFIDLGSELDFQVYPLLSYPATGAHNGSLPETGEMDGNTVNLADVFDQTNIIVALTEFSATAPLVGYTFQNPDLRAASMPTVSPEMQETALAADYSQLAQRCHDLGRRLEGAVAARLVFSTGHQMTFDLRNRVFRVDDGRLHPGGNKHRVINLPSGEVYIAPYEGEKEGVPSLTAGQLPLPCEGETLILDVDGNRIVKVYGDGPCADRMRGFFESDPARRNVAELGIGCNENALISGNVLEDEKVLGIHWAAGRSEHIGGTVGPEDFASHGNVVHWDFVYPFGGEITPENLIVEFQDGREEVLIHAGQPTW